MQPRSLAALLIGILMLASALYLDYVAYISGLRAVARSASVHVAPNGSVYVEVSLPGGVDAKAVCVTADGMEPAHGRVAGGVAVFWCSRAERVRLSLHAGLLGLIGVVEELQPRS